MEGVTSVVYKEGIMEGGRMYEYKENVGHRYKGLLFP